MDGGKRANIRNWLEDAEGKYGEPIEAIVVGKHYDAPYSEALAADEGVVLSRDTGLMKVDAAFDNGFGGADCFSVTAWTKHRVLFVHEHEGATRLHCVPRNPCAHIPAFDGPVA